MSMSIGVEYALHSLLYVAGLPTGSTVGLKELASLQNISPTYLSKIFTKLTKGGVLRSLPGVKGGYMLARPASEITFLHIIEAVEGNAPFFRCCEIRQKTAIFEDTGYPDRYKHTPCLIHTIMLEGEKRMKSYWNSITLQDLCEQVTEKLDDMYWQKSLAWLIERR